MVTLKYVVLQVKKDIEDFSNALNRLKEQEDKISGKVEKESQQRNHYKLKHIELKESAGEKGIRLKVSQQTQGQSADSRSSVRLKVSQQTQGQVSDSRSGMSMANSKSDVETVNNVHV